MAEKDMPTTKERKKEIAPVAESKEEVSVEPASQEEPQEEHHAKSTVQKKKIRRSSPEVLVFVKANFNNTIVTITDLEGKVLATSSPGIIGYSGARKSTAYAATRAAEDAVTKAQKYGVREAKVYIKGPGPGRNAAVKGLSSAGLRITLLSDVTPLPHNGCRPRKQPRK